MAGRKRISEGWTEFRVQRTSAERRSIPFLFTFEEWWAWWQVDDRWVKRGREKGCVMMARFRDQGPYAIENVYCATHGDNSKDAAAKVSVSVKAMHAQGLRTYGHLRRYSNPKGKWVAAPDGRQWPSALAAAEAVGITRQAMAMRCRRQTLGWSYA